MIGSSRARRGPAAFAQIPAALALLLVASLLLLAALLTGCVPRRSRAHPNVLWIVWDTVRADRLSLYGNARPTTPFLDQWAKKARVFDNCLTVASTTTPAHASMFTDLLPLEHGVDNTHCLLPDSLVTLPEIFREHGYQTFLYSENPFISRETGFGQGIDSLVVPWAPRWRARAADLLEQKIPPPFRNPQLGARLRQPGLTPWALSACGTLGQETLQGWLAGRDRGRPWFAFLNFMEAHAPVITPSYYRELMLGRAGAERSYALNVTPTLIWRYSLGLQDLSATDLEVIRGSYDGALRELDDLLRGLLTPLEQSGELKNTIVVLCADHGEFLGEHHMLDHEFSLAEPLLRVPLVLYYPPAVKRGRETLPVMNLDIFPTLLELAGIDHPRRAASVSVSLLAPARQRTRMAEFPTPPQAPLAEARAANPAFDARPYERNLRALHSGPYKYIWSSDGRHALYNLSVDPAEEHDLLGAEPETAARLASDLETIVSSHRRRTGSEGAMASPTPEQQEILRSLGYVGKAGKPTDGSVSGR